MFKNEKSGIDNKNLHAYLLIMPGVAAVRKRAKLLAKEIMCTNPAPDGISCGECSACKKIDAETHPDLHILGRRKVSAEDTRDMITEAYLSTNESDKKVFILEGMENFSTVCQNILLKVLEEPPKSVVFILTASSRSAVLATVLSRTSVFMPSEDDESEKWMLAEKISGKGKTDMSTMRVYAYIDAYEETDAESVRVSDIDAAFNLAEGYFSGVQTDVVPSFPSKKTEAEKIKLYFRVFMLVARNISVYKLSGGKENIIPYSEEFRKMCVKVSPKKAMGVYELFENALISLSLNANLNALYSYLLGKL